MNLFFLASSTGFTDTRRHDLSSRRSWTHNLILIRISEGLFRDIIAPLRSANFSGYSDSSYTHFFVFFFFNSYIRGNSSGRLAVHNLYIHIYFVIPCSLCSSGFLVGTRNWTGRCCSPSPDARFVCKFTCSRTTCVCVRLYVVGKSLVRGFHDSVRSRCRVSSPGVSSDVTRGRII